MRKYSRLIPVVLIVLLLVILVKCAVNPVTGKKEIMLVSKNQEIEMGRNIDRGLRQEYGLYNRPDLRAYVKRVGHSLVPYTHRQELQYHFEILDTPVANAFAAPGGYIYITRGLLALLNSEAELATVLGHELGHVNARHSVRNLSRNLLITLGIVLVGELNEDIKKVTPISMIAAQLLFLKYSRSDEYQADKLGIEYAFKAGYDSGEMIKFFSSLQNLSKVSGGGHLPNFLSTHPLTPRRIEKVKELLQTPDYASPFTAMRLAIRRNEYLNKINGLIYGKNPRQGYIEGQAFYHPGMRFYFKIPYGWKVNNTPQQVTMTSVDGKAVILLKAEQTTETLDGYAYKMKNTLTNPQILEEGFMNINGFNAFHTYLAVPVIENDEEQQPLNVQLSCIRKAGTIYTFFTAASGPDYPTYRYGMEKTIRSFKPLNTPYYLNRKPKRIKTRGIQRRRTLRSYLQGVGMPGDIWNRISLINAIGLDQTLQANQRIKIIK